MPSASDLPLKHYFSATHNLFSRCNPFSNPDPGGKESKDTSRIEITSRIKIKIKRKKALLAAIILLLTIPSVFAGPVAGMLADDTWTRGNWVGRYGGYAYALFGAKSPASDFGGPGWPVHLRGYTGDPNDSHRAWLSRMNTVADDRALQTPEGQSRIASVWDDHGEEKKMGEAPGLLIDLNLPDGLCLLSLYFFEIDWPQFRDYKLLLLSRETKKPVLATTAGHFFGGTYKRFALSGHRKITIQIDTLTSPNAVLAGLFIDRLDDLIKLPDWVAEESFEEDGNYRNQLAGKVVAAQKALKAAEEEGTGDEEYLTVEGQLLAFADWAEDKVPSAIFGLLHRESTNAQERLHQFARLSFSKTHQERALQLAWCWAAALADIPEQENCLKLIEALNNQPSQDAAHKKSNLPIRALASDSTTSLRARAGEQFKEGNFGSFATTMRQLAQQQSANMTSEDHYLLANALLYRGNYSEAVIHFSRAIKGGLTARASAWAYLNEIICLIRIGDPKRARELLSHFEAAHPSRTEFRHGQLKVAEALKKERPETARQMLQVLLENHLEDDSLRTSALLVLDQLSNEGRQKD